jgi:UDP-GlcNAc:undecaprenyl-phosphate GlcNAc-1-phosphate transferase
MLLVGVAIVVFVLMRKLGYLSLENTAAVQETRKRNAQLRTITRRVIEDCRVADSMQEIWSAVRPLAPELDVAVLGLRVGTELGAPDSRDAVSWEVERPGGNSKPLVARVEVRAASARIGEFVVDWRDGRAQINRDEELTLELVADAVGEAWSRIRVRRTPERRLVSVRR